MAVRILSYVGLALDESWRQLRGDRAADQVSIVLPGVIYNGASSWNPTTEVADLLVPRIRSAMRPASDELVAYHPRQLGRMHFLLEVARKVAAAIVDCETGEEFITRVREA